MQPEFFEEQAELGFWLTVTGELYLPVICGWNLNVDHLKGCEFLEHASGRQPWGQSTQPSRQGDMQAVGQKSDEDMGFDAGFELMENGPYSKVAFEIFKGLFDIP